MGVDSAALIKTLNKTCLNALQSAAGLCLSRTNPTVEVEHWLVKLTELPDSDLVKIFKHFEVNTVASDARSDEGHRRVPDGKPADPIALAQDRPVDPGGLGHCLDPVPGQRRSGRECCCWPSWTTKSWGGRRATPPPSWPRSRPTCSSPTSGSWSPAQPRTRGRRPPRAAPRPSRASPKPE